MARHSLVTRQDFKVLKLVRLASDVFTALLELDLVVLGAVESLTVPPGRD